MSCGPGKHLRCANTAQPAIVYEACGLVAGRTTVSQQMRGERCLPKKHSQAGRVAGVLTGRVALRPEHNKSLRIAGARADRGQEVVKPAAHRRANMNAVFERLRGSDGQALVEIGGVLVAVAGEEVKRALRCMRRGAGYLM